MACQHPAGLCCATHRPAVLLQGLPSSSPWLPGCCDLRLWDTCIMNACHALSAYTYCPTAWLRLCFSVLSPLRQYCFVFSHAIFQPRVSLGHISPAEISLNTTLQAWSRRLTLFVFPWSLPVLGTQNSIRRRGCRS